MEIIKKLYWMIVSIYVSIIIFLFSSIYNQFASIPSVPLYSAIKINEHLDKILDIEKALKRNNDSIQVVFKKIINNKLDDKSQSRLVKTFAGYYKENLLNIYLIEGFENWVKKHPNKRSEKIMPSVESRKNLCIKQNEILDLMREYLYKNKVPFQKLTTFKYKYYCLVDEYQTLNDYRITYLFKKDKKEIFFKIVLFIGKLFFKITVIGLLFAGFIEYLLPAGADLVEEKKSGKKSSD